MHKIAGTEQSGLHFFSHFILKIINGAVLFYSMGHMTHKGLKGFGWVKGSLVNKVNHG